MSNPFGIGEIHPPKDGFKKFILYREPFEDVTIWLILPESEESYRVNTKYLSRWMLPFFLNDEYFVKSALDHVWNFYHCEFEIGILRVSTLPLSDAYSYNLGGDGLDLVTKLANKVKSAVTWNY